MFTEQAREVIVCAQDEAREMGHGTVQVEHLLLGLFSDQDGIAGPVFASFGLAVEQVRDLVRQQLAADFGPLGDDQLRFSPEAKDALRFANRIATGEPGTEHLLIAIVGRGENRAHEILHRLGVDPNRIRFETKKLAWPQPAGPRPELRLVRSMPLESLPEIDLRD